MQDFFSRYKLSMLRMYTYHTMIHNTVGFSISISLVYLFAAIASSVHVEFWKDPRFDCSLLHFVAFLHLPILRVYPFLKCSLHFQSLLVPLPL